MTGRFGGQTGKCGCDDWEVRFGRPGSTRKTTLIHRPFVDPFRALSPKNATRDDFGLNLAIELTGKCGNRRVPQPTSQFHAPLNPCYEGTYGLLWISSDREVRFLEISRWSSVDLQNIMTGKFRVLESGCRPLV